MARRTLTIEDGVLVRVASPQGVWVRAGANAEAAPLWDRARSRRARARGRRADERAPEPRRRARAACSARRPRACRRSNRHLPEIAALIDPRQFELITARDAGVVVIQGGAGSGKTTVGLHRLALPRLRATRASSRPRACWS